MQQIALHGTENWDVISYKDKLRVKNKNFKIKDAFRKLEIPIWQRRNMLCIKQNGKIHCLLGIDGAT